jgi:UDP-N-acetylmuramoyl-tripeptide--D-alanyl-D-alanine ligase
VPLTLLRLRREHRLAVVELGMNHPGEIAVWPPWPPTVALVNNAQREHQEFMATVEAVARENGAVSRIAADGTAVFPADDAYTPAVARTGRHAPRADLRRNPGRPDVPRHGQAVWQQGAWALQAATPPAARSALHIAGRHNVRNALAAAACALAAGVPLAAVAEGLGRFVPVQGARASTLNVRGVPSRWSTTATTPTPTRCAPPSTCWPNAARPRAAGAGRHGRGGRAGPGLSRRGVAPRPGQRHRTPVGHGRWMAQASCRCLDASAAACAAGPTLTP